ncbi:hypothetical protein [Bradyrhizobium sp.]|uniref:hypothetical protein n=1 Tax=Bradyrhizobium sp. TaxID=376 RepID=UPI003C762E54
MADKAFALSPISARAAQPDEADYGAIREAFMETASGRWFLGEYAKRNRNADTRMVLDEMARIEQALEALQQSASDTRLSEILAAIMNVVDQATEIAASAANGLAIDDRLAPIRRGAGILKEISRRWREIGAESRICDSIDSQVDAICESCSQLARVDIRAALTAAFELMRTRIEVLAEENGLAVQPAANPAAKFYSAATTVQVAGEDDTLACTMMLAPDIELATLAGIDAHPWGDAADGDCVEPARSETMVVAEQIEPVPIRAGGYAVPPATQPEFPAAPPSPLHPSLGPTPFAAEFLEPRPPDTDPSSAIRRMSLVEKIAFFA